MIGFQNDWIPKGLDSKMIRYQNGSKMIGFQNNRNGKMTTMINKVNTMTPRQNDLVVKNPVVCKNHVFEISEINFTNFSMK